MAVSIVLDEEDVPGAKLVHGWRTKTIDGLSVMVWKDVIGKAISSKERVRLAIDKIKVDPKVDGGKW